MELLPSQGVYSKHFTLRPLWRPTTVPQVSDFTWFDDMYRVSAHALLPPVPSLSSPCSPPPPPPLQPMGRLAMETSNPSCPPRPPPSCPHPQGRHSGEAPLQPAAHGPTRVPAAPPLAVRTGLPVWVPPPRCGSASLPAVRCCPGCWWWWSVVVAEVVAVMVVVVMNSD